MEDWKKELGEFVRLLGAILVAGLGCRMLAAGSGTTWSWGWFLIPKICGIALVLVGAGCVLYQLLRKGLGSLGPNLRVPPASPFAASPPSPVPLPEDVPEADEPPAKATGRKRSGRRGKR